MDLHPDFRDLLAEFARFGVKFVLVGGYAVAHHGRPRATKDLDLLLGGSPGNLNRASEALNAFGAPQNVVSAVRTLGPDEIAYMGAPPVRIDLLRSADGIETESTIARAVHVQIGDQVVPVIALPDLLANKRASGRPQDIADVAVLEGLADGDASE